MAALPQRIAEKIRPSEVNFYNGTPCWEWLAFKTDILAKQKELK